VFIAISSVLIFIPVVYSGLSGFLDYYGNFSMMNFNKFFSGDIEYLTGTTLKSMVFYTVIISVTASLISICINLVAGYYASRGKKFELRGDHPCCTLFGYDRIFVRFVGYSSVIEDYFDSYVDYTSDNIWYN